MKAIDRDLDIQLDDIRSEFRELFANKSVEEFRKICQNFSLYDEYKETHANIFDFNYIFEQEYNDILQKVIAEYIGENHLVARIKELEDSDVKQVGDYDFKYKGQERFAEDNYDELYVSGIRENCVFNIIRDAACNVESIDGTVEELALWICGVNFVYWYYYEDEDETVKYYYK